MRLGSRRTHFQVPDCKSAKLYVHNTTLRTHFQSQKVFIICYFSIFRYGNAKYVDERHRHRYEVIQLLVCLFP